MNVIYKNLQHAIDFHSQVLGDKMKCTVRFGNSFLTVSSHKVPLIYQALLPCSMLPRQAREFTKIAHKNSKEYSSYCLLVQATSFPIELGP